MLELTAIDEAARETDDALVELRRDIHRWPELAGGEKRTAGLVAERLRAAGLQVATGIGGHGVVAMLEGGAGAGPTVAYRADLDAVAADERFESDFASRVPGAAHVCGHDLHTAIGVGVAQVLARLRHRLPGRAVFLFQPAEETLAGAQAMIEAGALEQTTPLEIYALHCGPMPVGTIAVAPGNGQPGQDHYRIELSGPTVPSAADRLLAEIHARATIDLPQTPEQFQQLMADLEIPDGPLARFVFVRSSREVGHQQARLQVWVRAWPDERYPELRDEIGKLVAAAGGRIEFPGPPFPAMVCSPEQSEAAASYLRGTLGADAVVTLHAAFPFNGEDFALFLQRIPGAMFYLGVANPQAGIAGVPHSPHFAADERAIGVGVRAMAGLLADRLAALTAAPPGGG